MLYIVPLANPSTPPKKKDIYKYAFCPLLCAAIFETFVVERDPFAVPLTNTVPLQARFV